MPATGKEISQSQTREGPGRPAIGRPLLIRLGQDVEAAVDAWGQANGITYRAEAIRRLLSIALRAERRRS